jgi:hypothetical protein
MKLSNEKNAIHTHSPFYYILLPHLKITHGYKTPKIQISNNNLKNFKMDLLKFKNNLEKLLELGNSAGRF